MVESQPEKVWMPISSEESLVPRAADTLDVDADRRGRVVQISHVGIRSTLSLFNSHMAVLFI